MTAKELISDLRAMNALDPRECFLYLAAHAHEARLANGCRLLDQTDFTAWLLELSEAAKPQALDKTCPRCGHVHEGDRECGVFISESTGYCRCELEVPA